MKLDNKNLVHRPRRLRKNKIIRDLVRENWLHKDDLISPIFIIEGENIKKSILSMPGVYQWSIDRVHEEIKELHSVGIYKVLLFGIPINKDDTASNSYNKDGIIQKAIRELKRKYPKIFIITDICCCGYTNHGHCGVLDGEYVDNDSTLEVLAKQAISYVIAGADMVAPSAMMDGMVAKIRNVLDKNNFNYIPIMSYSAKYASSFYGPFREAADSSPKFGDRKQYQMNISNINEALKEIKLDISEGADIVMVKPALSYLDVIFQAKQIFDVPIACYNVSGEYSMLKAASKENWIDHNNAMMEMVISMKRSGADIIITYFAKDVARLLLDGYE